MKHRIRIAAACVAFCVSFGLAPVITMAQSAPARPSPAEAAAAARSASAKAKLPEAPGKETTVRVCGVCHSVEVSISRRESREGWNAIVVNMVERGAKGSDEEFGEVVDYLTAHFPPGTPGGKLNINTATAPDIQRALDLSPEQAASLLKYREQKGKIQNFADLANVPGIDTVMLASKRALIVY